MHHYVNTFQEFSPSSIPNPCWLQVFTVRDVNTYKCNLLLRKILNCDFSSQEIKYSKKCKLMCRLCLPQHLCIFAASFTCRKYMMVSDWRRKTIWMVDGGVTPLFLPRPPLQYIIILPRLSVNVSWPPGTPGLPASHVAHLQGQTSQSGLQMPDLERCHTTRKWYFFEHIFVSRWLDPERKRSHLLTRSGPFADIKTTKNNADGGKKCRWMKRKSAGII